MSTLQAEMQRLAARPGMTTVGCANVWAGTIGLDLVGALNVKAANPAASCKGLAGVLNQLAGTSGLAEVGAAKAIV